MVPVPAVPRGSRPTLFFVAAKKNGSAYCGRCCSDSGFQAQTWESLQDFPKKHTPACSDSGFEGVNLGIAAGKPSRMALEMQ